MIKLFQRDFIKHVPIILHKQGLIIMSIYRYCLTHGIYTETKRSKRRYPSLLYFHYVLEISKYARFVE